LKVERHIYFVLSALALLSFASSTTANACACCSDPGMRVESVEDLDRNQEELARLRFDDAAQLFASPAFPDDIEGVDVPSGDPYKFGVVEGTRWTFDLSDAAERQGTIVFPLPSRLVRFEVDPREEEVPPIEYGPRLYKEWRLTNTSELGGIVAQGNTRAQATLILHGHGNACTSAEDFTHWTLVIDGPGVKFTLLGKLAPPAPLPNDRPH
jgi:uncharacterized protein YqiB (DUF1249 family)